MKTIRNNIIPFRGFAAVNLFGVLFVRKGARVTQRMINHECIHTAQMKETLYIFFYVWYVLEWATRLFMKGNAYRNISFEREAYANQKDGGYLKGRKRYAWTGYLRGSTYRDDRR